MSPPRFERFCRGFGAYSHIRFLSPRSLQIKGPGHVFVENVYRGNTLIPGILFWTTSDAPPLLYRAGSWIHCE